MEKVILVSKTMPDYRGVLDYRDVRLERFHCMWGKVLRFFPSPPSYIHGFSTLQNNLECVNESFAFLM